MKIKRNNFLIQVKYSGLLSDTGNIEKHFFGFGGELYLSAEEISNYDLRIIETIKSFATENHLPLRLHAPLAEFDYSQPKKTISHIESLYKKVIKLCRILELNFVVAHAEFNYLIDFPIERQFENAVSLWGILCNEFSANRIHINIENHLEIEPNRLIMLMERVNSPYLGMCVDIGHFNAFSNLGIQKWLEKYPLGSIREVHLADNQADGDTHLPLGEGNVDFAGFFETFTKRREDASFVLEPRNINEAQRSLSFLAKLGIL